MSNPYIVKMPQLSDTMTEGVIVSWEKEVGAAISRGDIVATVETDKAIMDVEVFRDGFLSGPLAEIDSTVAVGGAIAYIVEDASAVGQINGDAAEPMAAPESIVPPAHVAEVIAEPIADEVPEGISHKVKMPQLSDTMEEGIVVEWAKQLGDEVARGDIVAQVETDKAIMDVEVFRDGFLSGPIAAIDAVIPVGGTIAYIVEDKAHVLESQATITTTPNTTNNQPPKNVTAATVVSTSGEAGSAAIGHGNPAARPKKGAATPYARKLAGDQINLSRIKGSGPDGVIIARDVMHAHPAAASINASAASIAPAAVKEMAVPGNGRNMSSMEKAVSHNMTASLSMPTFNTMVNAKPENLIAAAKKQGVSITVAIAKACAMASVKHPTINSCYQPIDKIVERSNVDIGMAVAADDGGLVVPVLRNCEVKELAELNEEWKDLVARARIRRLTPDEYAHPTFMVSNMGMLGVDYFDAIPTPGLGAILAISANSEKGMPLTVTADHRVVNGANVAMYLNSLKGFIEQPEEWMGGAAGPTIPEGDWDYDAVIIGGGPGGEDCARDLVAHGLKVAMINDAPLPGGECLWRGCIPSKAWRAAADLIRDRANDEHLGVEGTTKAKLNWDKLEKTRKHVLETRGELALKTDKGVRIKVIQGFARFESDHSISIDTSGNTDDPHLRAMPGDKSKTETITFGCAVIAAGAPPFIPPIPGAQEGVEKGGVLTSDTVWGLEKAPKKLGVIGGGAIGLEMAQIFQDFGTKVVLLEAQDRILAEVEPEIAKHLTDILNEDENLTIRAGAAVSKISGGAGDMKISYTDAEGKKKNYNCDYVVMATGKRPVVDGMQLDKAGIAMDGSVIGADDRSRTNVPHIYAVGDVVGGLMLAHTAGQQGRVAAATILGEDFRYNQDKDCGVIFTRPEAAFVGLSVDQAKEKGIDAVEVKTPISLDAKAMITNETHGMIKIVVDKANQKIIGVHFLADHADTLIGEGVMMVSAGLTLQQVAQAIHPHPTQTEMFGDMARRLLSRLRRSAKRKTK